MPCIRRSLEINYSKQKVIIEPMKSVMIIPRSKQEFNVAFSLSVDFSKERKRFSWEESKDTGLVFLMKESDGKAITKSIPVKKTIS